MGGFSIHIELKLLNGDEGLDIYNMLQDIAQVENGLVAESQVVISVIKEIEINIVLLE